MRYLQHLLVAALVAFFSQPGSALVDPEVEAWNAMVKDVQAALEIPGSEILGEALEEMGALGGALAKAPLEDYMVELEARRGLKFKYFTPWHAKDKKELRVFIEEQLAKEYTPKKLVSDKALLQALGLVDADFEIMPFLEELYTDQIAGAYDPAADQFFIVDTSGGQPFRKQLLNKATRTLMDTTGVVIIHELDHALGGQHFALRKVYDSLIHDWSLDRQMAAMALVEGDATFVMIDHQRKTRPADQGANTLILNMDALTEILGAMAEWNLPGMGLEGFANAPLFFQKSLIFPYYGGAEFVSTLRHSAVDWRVVDNAYDLELLPVSTEQIYHPSTYTQLARAPKNPNFSKLPAKFGAWQKVTDNTGGEFLLRIVLEQHGAPTPNIAAQGWNGDRIRIYSEPKTEKLAFLWVVRWDSVSEALEFHRLSEALPFQLQREGPATLISSGFSSDELKELRKTLEAKL